MRAVVQRVSSASVTVEDAIIGKINKGLLVLLGVEDLDSEEDVVYLAEKVSNLRIFEDDKDKMNLSLVDVQGELLVISQFTLHGDCRKGRRPNFMKAAGADKAEGLYKKFITECKNYIQTVENGKFQAHMEVSLVNDGPVTILIDSKRVSRSGKMIFQIFPAGVFQANCYILGDNSTKEGIVVDPGGDPKGIINQINELGIIVKYIVLTHGHGDHIGAVHELKEATGAKILISRKDDFLIRGATKELIPILRNMKLFEADEYLEDGRILTLGNMEIIIIETPGHTPGGVTLKVEDILITGDTLFRGSIGRTDFEFGSFDAIISSIKNKLMIFEDDIKVFPGHGPSTTIGYERKLNPFLK